MKKLLVALVLLLGLARGASAQITVPYTFTPGTVILASEVNANFSTVSTNALNRTGGTVTGNVTVNGGITIDGADIGAHLVGGQVRSTVAGTAGSPAFSSTADTTTGMYFPAAGEIAWALSGVQRMGLHVNGLSVFGNNIINNVGKIPAISSTYFSSLDGSALTGILEANITDGSILARVAANETISGAWTFNIGTISTDVKIAQFLSTWNNAGVTFTGVNIDVTDTASAATSKLLDLKVGGSSVASVDKTGKLTATSLQLTTGATNGHVLTSDASGNATWQAAPAGSTGVPTGMVAWFESSCPGGWTRRSGAGETYENKFIRGGATYSAGGGGADTHTHSVDPPNTTSTGHSADHTHNVDIASTGSSTDGDHTHSVSGSSASTDISHTHSFTTGGPSASTGALIGGTGVGTSAHTHSGTTDSAGGSHSHTLSVTTASQGGHSHTFNPVATASGGASVSHTHDVNVGSFTSGSGSNVPAYVQVVVCKKD